MSNRIEKGLTARAIQDGQENYALNKEIVPILISVRDILNTLDDREDMVSVSTSYSMGDEAALEYTGGAGSTITLPAVGGDAGQARARVVINNGSAAVTLAARAGDTVNDAASTSLTNAALALFYGNSVHKWRSLGGTFRASGLTLTGNLSVGGTASVTGRLTANGDQVKLSQATLLVVQGPFPVTGAHEGALLGDGVNMRFGTNQVVRIGGFDFGGGVKIGFAPTEALGFWGVTPVAQPGPVADATGAGDVVAQLNALLAAARSSGIIKT